jgi:hypothetical protein
MKTQPLTSKNRACSRGVLVGAASVPLLMGALITNVQATEPCGDFGECKVLIEINASDGDIGFHWLADGDDLRSSRIRDPNNKLVYTNRAFVDKHRCQILSFPNRSTRGYLWEHSRHFAF